MLLYATALAASIPLILAHPAPLSKRDTVQYQIFPAGNCAGDSIITQTINTPFQSCYNFGQGGNYGAMLTGNNANCRIKIWELPDCHGKAAIHVEDTQCVPIANKHGALYLVDGASSLSLDCDTPPQSVTITATSSTTQTITTTLTATRTYTTNEPFTTTSTYISVATDTVSNSGTAFGNPVDADPGTSVSSQIEIRVESETISKTVDKDGNEILEDEGYKYGDEIEEQGDSNEVTEGPGGEEGEDTPGEHLS
jgi:hypothetical protein